MTRSPAFHLAVAGSLLLAVAAAQAAPKLENASFEAERYTKWPGYARQHDSSLAGWKTEGSAGVNPLWKNPEKQRGPDSPFHDNGKTPHGKQLGFIQGPGKLSQRVDGFEKGRRYRVTFRENGRIQRRGDRWSTLRVTLGGEVIVSPHEVPPVGKSKDFAIPFYRVESGVFTAPDDGAYDLVFETVQESGTTTVLLDDVRIEEAK